MKKILFSMLIYSFLLTGVSYSDGKVKIKSDVKGAFIYIDGEKRAMTGDGYTTITLPEGEHRVLLQKQIDEKTYKEGNNDIYIGENTEVELFIDLKSIKKGKVLAKRGVKGNYICILDGNRGFSMKIKEKDLTLHMFNPMSLRTKNFTSEYTVSNKKIYTSLSGKDLYFYEKNNQLFSSDKKFPVICDKEFSKEKQRKISKESDVIGLWKIREKSITYEFKESGELISSTERKGKIKTEHSKWLLNNDYTLMMTAPSQQSDDYALITKFELKNSKAMLSLYKNTVVFERLK